jgi:Sialic acid synthase
MMDAGHISIGGREVGGGRPCFIIAEAGINHKRRRDARRGARRRGGGRRRRRDQVPDAFPEHEMLRGGATAAYVGESLFDLLTRTALSRDAHFELRDRAKKRGIIFPVDTVLA